jgi:hypothetical protein
MKKLVLVALILGGCKRNAAISVWLDGAPIERVCETHTTALGEAWSGSDPCVAYWLRKIAEKK